MHTKEIPATNHIKMWIICWRLDNIEGEKVNILAKWKH